MGTLLVLQGKVLGLGPVSSNGVRDTYGYLPLAETWGLTALSEQFAPGLESTGSW